MFFEHMIFLCHVTFAKCLRLSDFFYILKLSCFSVYRRVHFTQPLIKDHRCHLFIYFYIVVSVTYDTCPEFVPQDGMKR